MTSQEIQAVRKLLSEGRMHWEIAFVTRIPENRIRGIVRRIKKQQAT